MPETATKDDVSCAYEAYLVIDDTLTVYSSCAYQLQIIEKQNLTMPLERCPGTGEREKKNCSLLFTVNIVLIKMLMQLYLQK